METGDQQALGEIAPAGRQDRGRCRRRFRQNFRSHRRGPPSRIRTPGRSRSGAASPQTTISTRASAISLPRRLLQQGWNRDSTYQVYLNSMLEQSRLQRRFREGGVCWPHQFLGLAAIEFLDRTARCGARFVPLCRRPLAAVRGDGARRPAELVRQRRSRPLRRRACQLPAQRDVQAACRRRFAGRVELTTRRFATQRYFYGAGIELPQLRKGFDTSLYVVEQRDGADHRPAGDRTRRRASPART